MSGPLRNKLGCWTCRVRRKKCDGARPQCSTCESLSITCYGYGPKPDWFDHGEQEKAMVDSFKQVVKRTSRKKTAANFLKSRVSLAKLAPKSSNGASSSSSPGSQHNNDPSQGRSSSVDDGVNTPQGSLPEKQPKNDQEDIVLFPISAHESASLMHYLDNVFPLQYPMYKPGVLEGGRGWLLAPMLRLRPLFHAALALSSYHLRKVTLADSRLYRHQCQVVGLIEQEKHLEICLVEFQRMLRAANETVQKLVCPRHGLSIMALVVQLIFFEFFTGQGSEWKIHLRAATNLHQRYLGENLIPLSLSERSRAILRGEDHLLSKDDAPEVMEEIMTFRFFTGTITWLDIMSSITTGAAPRLQPIQLSDISLPSCPINLEEIMGCKNWVMIQIGRIAALHELKNQALQEGHLVNTNFEETASDISREIQSGLAQTALEGLSFSDGNNDFPMQNSTVLTSRTLVTHVFALMASIYLHLVIYGFQNLELVENTINAAMEILKAQVPAHLLPSMTCPLYMIGTVAGQEEERVFFRKIFSSPPLVDPLYEHRAKVLPALEEIWRRRENRNDFTWGESLELVPDLIL